MTKTTLCLTSLIAAIPGAWLACLMVMAFLSYAGGGTVKSKALSGIMLIIGAMLAAMPVAILVFGGKKAAKPGKDETPPAEEEPEDEVEPAEATGDDSELEVASDSAEEETIKYESDDQAIPDEFDLGSDFEMDEVDEDAGKKKKKK